MRRGVVALLTLVALTACGDHTSSQAPGRPHEAGAGARAAAPGTCVAPPVRPVTPSSPGRPAGAALGDLALPCFPDGGDVRLAALGRPAVINLWASWCAPCRDELPQVEGYYRKAGGSVLVIGVIIDTARPAARDIVSDLGLTFPMVYDREKRLLPAVGVTTLPATVFLDAGGRVAYVQKKPVDAASIRQLSERYLGVAVPA
jgi:cytochrome c biogenesis protein CcmG/thiol:disulfide interchange protein DsbE